MRLVTNARFWSPFGPRMVRIRQKNFSRWSPVCRNMSMPGAETMLCGVKQHSGAPRGPRLAPGCPGHDRGSRGGLSWGRPRMRQLWYRKWSPGMSRLVAVGRVCSLLVTFCSLLVLEWSDPVKIWCVRCVRCVYVCRYKQGALLTHAPQASGRVYVYVGGIIIHDYGTKSEQK